ncbi:hypothetical protein [Aporhodopirellula aestuarii]|uniref:Uncharacterized protein n=1 Tax=Aporhodopirellula aestuarii TaxID=2950107 RepID=A0ABT0UDF3_9BACT|nr:hypothetical protein [Aporhodopirellula aestuarii]MCM2374940.1 hypothetical protein [Aporhodopirellula aestuarii]
MKAIILIVILISIPSLAQAEETFVKIQRVSGNQIAVVKDDGGAGRGMRGGATENGPSVQTRRGRGRSQGTATPQPTIISVNRDVKITSAMRERRTSEFRVGAELAGGLKHRVFQNMQSPLSARVATEGNRITEINVIVAETDINQSSTTAGGQAVLAVRPKRPPTKRRSN